MSVEVEAEGNWRCRLRRINDEVELEDDAELWKGGGRAAVQQEGEKKREELEVEVKAEEE